MLKECAGLPVLTRVRTIVVWSGYERYGPDALEEFGRYLFCLPDPFQDSFPDDPRDDAGELRIGLYDPKEFFFASELLASGKDISIALPRIRSFLLEEMSGMAGMHSADIFVFFLKDRDGKMWCATVFWSQDEKWGITFSDPAQTGINTIHTIIVPSV